MKLLKLYLQYQFTEINHCHCAFFEFHTYEIKSVFTKQSLNPKPCTRNRNISGKRLIKLPEIKIRIKKSYLQLTLKMLREQQLAGNCRISEDYTPSFKGLMVGSIQVKTNWFNRSTESAGLKIN